MRRHRGLHIYVNKIQRCKILRRSRSARRPLFDFFRFQPTTIGFRLHEQHHTRDIVIKQCTQPNKLRVFLRLCVNSLIIDPRPQHFDLISQQLEPSVVSRAEFSLQNLLKNLKYFQITAHISSDPVCQNPLQINMLCRPICFRTPRKVKEYKKNRTRTYRSTSKWNLKSKRMVLGKADGWVDQSVMFWNGVSKISLDASAI